MNPEIEKLNKKIEELENKINLMYSSTTIPFEVEQAIRARLNNLLVNLPADLFNAPLSSVTDASGGATVDLNARAVITTIITRLEDLGLINPN